jgi:hypothetical protein
MEDNSKEITDWEGLINKPCYTDDRKEVGIILSVEPEKLVVSRGPVTPDKYLIPKSSIHNFDRGIVYLNESSDFVENNYKFE